MKRIHSSTLTLFAAIAALYLAMPGATSAAVITGTFADYPEVSVSDHLLLGDGIHSVTVGWTVANPNHSAYFVGADFTYYAEDTEVAFADGITSIEQIIDASIFSFTRGSTSLIPEGSFVLFRNIHNGYYGAVRIDDIFPYLPEPALSPYAGMNGTWWFQTDGSGNFSRAAVPENLSTGLPIFMLLFIYALVGANSRKRSRTSAS